MRFLIEQFEGAMSRGDRVNQFWFDDRAWRRRNETHVEAAISEDATLIIEELRKRRAASGGAQ